MGHLTSLFLGPFHNMTNFPVTRLSGGAFMLPDVRQQIEKGGFDFWAVPEDLNRYVIRASIRIALPLFRLFRAVSNSLRVSSASGPRSTGIGAIGGRANSMTATVKCSRESQTTTCARKRGQQHLVLTSSSTFVCAACVGWGRFSEAIRTD